MDARCQEYSRLPNVICLLLEGQIPIFAKLPYFVTIINRSNGAKNMCQHLNAIGINSTQKKKRYNVVHQNDKFSCKQLYKIKVCTDFVRWVPFLCACVCMCKCVSVYVYLSVLVYGCVCQNYVKQTLIMKSYALN